MLCLVHFIYFATHVGNWKLIQTNVVAKHCEKQMNVFCVKQDKSFKHIKTHMYQRYNADSNCKIFEEFGNPECFFLP